MSDESEMIDLVARQAEAERARKARYASAHPEEARTLEEALRETEELVSDLRRALSMPTTDRLGRFYAGESIGYAERVQRRVVDVVLKRARAMEHYLWWFQRDAPPTFGTEPVEEP